MKNKKWDLDLRKFVVIEGFLRREKGKEERERRDAIPSILFKEDNRDGWDSG